MSRNLASRLALIVETEINVLTRRQLLTRGAALSGLSSWKVLAGDDSRNQTLFASAFSLNKDQHFFSIFDQEGTIKWQQALPERAHAPIVHPNKPIVAVVARRPGFYIDLYKIDSAQRLMRIEPEKDHHFYGHGLFTPDGLSLITQENHYPSGQGKIFIRSVATGEVLKQFPSYGIGPHESCLLNNDTLVVANGGLQTHPDNDRRILNLETMQASLCFISLTTGELINKLVLPDELHQLSIRHLDINKEGTVAVGFQYQGDKWDDVPLVATANLKSEKLNFLPIPLNISRRLQHYCGSVAYDKSGNTLAITSPRGDLVVYWQTKNWEYLTHHNFQDVCGLSHSEKANEFLVTTGKGKRIFVNPITDNKLTLARMTKWKWDNHLHLLKV